MTLFPDMKKLLLAVCIAAIAAGILFPLFLPHMVPVPVLVLTNLACVVLTAAVMRPAGLFMRKYVARREKEIYTRLRREEEMKEKLAALEREKRDLENRLDTRAQAGSMPSEVNFTFKLEQMEYARKGYIVEEEPLEAYDSDPAFAQVLPRPGAAGRLLGKLGLSANGASKVLFIKKYYYKTSIGLDFSKIKYSFDGDRLLLSGVRYTQLHDISGEMERDRGDIRHCWITDAEGRRIVGSRTGEAFKKAYEEFQDYLAREEMASDATLLCEEYTKAFRESLRNRYENLDFVEGIEDSDRSWTALRDGTPDSRIAETASYMLALSDIIRKTA